MAVARSGDKGGDVNLGVIARRPEYFEALKSSLNTEIIAHHFKELFDSQVVNVLGWELPHYSSQFFDERLSGRRWCL